jgi:hypothetical protein
MINGINIRFNQEKMDMIQSIKNVLPLNKNSNDISGMSTVFNLNSDKLKTEIYLLKHTANTPKEEKTNAVIG